MRASFNFISLALMAAATLFTFQAIAAPAPAQTAPSEVHLLNNLDETDLRLVMKIMEERGYKVVDRKEIFTKSSKTVSVTKALADERDPASVEVQVLSLDKGDALPKTVFNHKVITDDVSEALKSLPRPGELPVLGKNH